MANLNYHPGKHGGAGIPKATQPRRVPKFRLTVPARPVYANVSFLDTNEFYGPANGVGIAEFYMARAKAASH